MKKLSEMADDAEIVCEAFGKITVADVKSEITEHGHDSSKYKWYIPVPQKWIPDAKVMAETYIDNEYDDMFEDWDNLARECLDGPAIKKLQTLLEETFASVIDYYKYGEEVEIDIFPTKTV